VTDPKQALVQALSIMGLKARDAEQIVTTLKESHQVEVDDSEGFLSLKQNGADVNPATVLQAYFRQHPQDFIGHSGEIRYKSDVKDDKAKVALIREKGIDYWTALPATENSPTGQHVVKPAIVSTQMKRSEWLQLTPREKTAAITSWGNKAIGIVSEIQSRR